MNNWTYDYRYPAIEDLRRKAMRKIPKFAFEYLDGGCNSDINLKKNTAEIRQVELKPNYLENHKKPDLSTSLFGHVYDAPFGIAPVALQGLIWPKGSEILAKASLKHNVPFVLSTVSTMSIEQASELTEGRAWFQLYHPKEKKLRNDIIHRAKAAACPVLVLLCDVPTFGFRPRDIRNGLSMPPRMNMKNFIQIMKRPEWALRTLMHGQPQFETLKPYMPKNLDLSQLGTFMDQTFSGKLNEDRIAEIRDLWHGKIVLKGVANTEDVEKAVKLGIDGIIVSNHGGRQLDAGQSAIKALEPIVSGYKGKIKIMMDSGIRTGPDIANSLASGAEFTFLGRSPMYSIAALGHRGGDHMMSLLKVQLKQVMDQLGCADPLLLNNHRIPSTSKFT